MTPRDDVKGTRLGAASGCKLGSSLLSAVPSLPLGLATGFFRGGVLLARLVFCCGLPVSSEDEVELGCSSLSSLFVMAGIANEVPRLFFVVTMVAESDDIAACPPLLATEGAE